ncbi:hypothetical protein F4802DRAFT_71792 [Xylaria palmicola]|nr:hypothetical protein F4802DRAFT_71792 [Xylaria palmicola]
MAWAPGDAPIPGAPGWVWGSSAVCPRPCAPRRDHARLWRRLLLLLLLFRSLVSCLVRRLPQTVLSCPYALPVLVGAPRDDHHRWQRPSLPLPCLVQCPLQMVSCGGGRVLPWPPALLCFVVSGPSSPVSLGERRWAGLCPGCGCCCWCAALLNARPLLVMGVCWPRFVDSAAAARCGSLPPALPIVSSMASMILCMIDTPWSE